MTLRQLAVVLVLLWCPALAGPLHAQGKATYVDAAKVIAGGTFVTEPAYRVQMLTRTAAGQAEVHVKETDIFYVVAGDATFVTGGTVVGGHETQANQIQGTSINGGETVHLKKGDSITVPAGVPHWFKEVSSSIQYFTVKSIAP